MKKALMIGSILLAGGIGVSSATPTFAQGKPTLESCLPLSLVTEVNEGDADACAGGFEGNDFSFGGGTGSLLDELNVNDVFATGGGWLAYGKSDDSTGGVVNADENQQTGNWSVDFSDIAHDIKSFAVSLKAGNGYSIYLFEDVDTSVDKAFSGTFDTEGTLSNYPDLSHMTIAYLKSEDDNGPGPEPVPEPAAMAGLMAVGAGIVINRRKKSQ